MPTQVTDVPVYAGDPMLLEYTMEDDAEGGIDLSGWEFTCQWRRSRSSTESIDLTVDDSNKATGVVRISATSDQTTEMGGNGIFDLQVVDDSEDPFTWLWARTVWTRDVTRD